MRPPSNKRPFVISASSPVPFFFSSNKHHSSNKRALPIYKHPDSENDIKDIDIEYTDYTNELRGLLCHLNVHVILSIMTIRATLFSVLELKYLLLFIKYCITFRCMGSKRVPNNRVLSIERPLPKVN